MSFPAGTGFAPNEILDGSLQPRGNVSGARYERTPSGTTPVAGTPVLLVQPAVFTPRSAQVVTTKGRSNADGSVSLAFPTTGLGTGLYSATVTGETSKFTASATIEIAPSLTTATGAAAGSGDTNSSGPLAFTGAPAVTQLIIGGAALVAAGAGVVAFARKRKVSA